MHSQYFNADQLANFLNLTPVYSELLEQEVNLSEDDENQFIDLLITEKIKLSTFEKLQIVVAHLFNGISLENISKDKLNSLIINGHISANGEHYRELKEIDYKLSCLLLEKDLKDSY